MRRTGIATNASYAMSLLVLAYVMNFIDRQLVTLLLNDIRHDLQLNDSKLGLVSGTAFALFYVLAGLPIGHLADRVSRVRLLAASILVWSGMTAACGMTQNFFQLLLARTGVAIGEAGGTPASLSLIGDYYPPEKRSSKLGIYFSGAAIATLLAYALGGWINEAIGWRMTFAVFALPGVAIGLALILTVREPPRAPSERSDFPDDISFAARLGILWANPVFRLLCLGYGLSSIVGFTTITWGPSLAMRRFGLTTGDIGLAMGLATGTIAGAGHIFGGLFADRLSRRGGHVPLYYVAATQVACGLLVVFFLIAPSFGVFAILFGFAYGAGTLYAAPSMAVTQLVAPAHLRGLSAAILLLVATVGGLGVGPLAVGAISDYLQPQMGEQSLRVALFVLAPLNLAAALSFQRAGAKLSRGWRYGNDRGNEQACPSKTL